MTTHKPAPTDVASHERTVARCAFMQGRDPSREHWAMRAQNLGGIRDGGDYPGL